MEDLKAIGYVVYAQTRGTFLGKLGKWYTDVRLASVYAEPRAASAACNRLEVSFPVLTVPATIHVRGHDVENAVADAEAAKQKAPETKPETAPKTPDKPAPKVGPKAA